MTELRQQFERHMSLHQLSPKIQKAENRGHENRGHENRGQTTFFMQPENAPDKPAIFVLDEALTGGRRGFRDISSRAQITSTSFVNEYNYGTSKVTH